MVVRAYLNDLFAFLSALHARKADAATLAVLIAQNASADHHSELRQHRLEQLLVEAGWQVGDVQISRVLLLLLQ
jgi:hypothetical protein